MVNHKNTLFMKNLKELEQKYLELGKEIEALKKQSEKEEIKYPIYCKNKYTTLVCLFIIVNLVAYLLGAFVTWDWNVMNWLLFKDWQGRFFLVCVELLIMVPVSINALQEQES